jgi:hypothetical protein
MYRHPRGFTADMRTRFANQPLSRKWKATKLTEQERHTSVIGVLILSGICGLALLCASIAGLLHSPQKADHCDMSAEEHAIPSLIADGTLKKVGDIYYVHRDEADDVFVAACFPRRGGAECHGPIKLVDGHANEPVHVEFCGKTVSRLTLSGRDIRFSLPTQIELDAVNTKKRRVDWAILGIAALTIAGSMAGFRTITRQS